MSDKATRRLLREYIRESLNEEISGLSGSGGWYWLPAFTAPLGLWKPFVDVGKTALAGVLDMSQRVWGLVKTTLKAVTVSIIPFAKANFENINRTTHSRTQAIMSKFSDVFERTDKALGHNDLHAIAFMMNPAAYILAKAMPSEKTLKSFAAAKKSDARHQISKTSG
jgi:hypothetical protein